MIGIGPASLGLPWGQVWFQWFPLLICQISSCHARSVPAAWFCKQTLVEFFNAVLENNLEAAQRAKEMLVPRFQREQE
jgi:hypothetical protein